MNKPVWLLDVDGVLNAFAKVKHLRYSANQWGTWETFETSLGYVMTYSPELLARIDALVKADKVEVVWLTTWWNDIHRLPFTSLLNARVANNQEDFDLAWPDWWKLTVAQRFNDGRKMVWTDDDIDAVKNAWRWADEQENVLALSPNGKYGLTPSHMSIIERFLE